MNTLLHEVGGDFISESEAKAMAIKSAPAIERARKLKAQRDGVCPNCEGESFQWEVSKRGPKDVTDGRLRMSEISVIAFQFCEDCSETIRILEEHEINELLNQVR